MSPSLPHLIIFDCDGVLVDSEPLAMQVLLDAIARQGIVIAPRDAFRSFLGRSLASISMSLHETYGMPLSEEALASMRGELYALYRRKLQAMTGLVEALDRLTVPYCVASSSNPERIRVSLTVTGLIERFTPHIFSATMVEHGKPAPDLFLFAAKSMDVPPKHCLVIEDSPAGISAARSAGMRVFGYLGGAHIEASGVRNTIETLKPDAIFTDMRTLPDLISSLQGKQKAD